MLISSSYGDESYDAVIVSPNCGDRGEDGKEQKKEQEKDGVSEGTEQMNSYIMACSKYCRCDGLST